MATKQILNILKLIFKQKKELLFFVFLCFAIIITAFIACLFENISNQNIAYIINMLTTAFLIGSFIQISKNFANEHNTIQWFEEPVLNLKKGVYYLATLSIYGLLIFFSFTFFLILITKSQGPIINLALFITFIIILYLDPAIRILSTKSDSFKNIFNLKRIFDVIKKSQKEYLKLVLKVNVIFLGLCYITYIVAFFAESLCLESSPAVYYLTLIFCNVFFLIPITLYLIIASFYIGNFTKKYCKEIIKNKETDIIDSPKAESNIKNEQE